MAMRVRNDVLPYWTGVDAKLLMRASKLVAAVTSFPVQYNKAIVGQNAFAHESGIHQDGMLKNAQTYEIMMPEDVGVRESSLGMGKHSGRHAFREKLKDLGYELGDNALEDAFQRFKDLADRKKQVFDEDIEALADQADEDLVVRSDLLPGLGRLFLLVLGDRFAGVPRRKPGGDHGGHRAIDEASTRQIPLVHHNSSG